MDTEKKMLPNGTDLQENSGGEKDLLSILNEYQRNAVFDNSRACLVNANVGSGKTTVLTAKVIYLVEVCKIPLDRIVVLTFTNKAAKEIQDRLHKHIPMTQKTETLYFGTFHSVAMQMLKRLLPVEKLGYTKDFSVIDPDEELDLAEQLIDEHSLIIKHKNRLPKRLERALSGHENAADQKLHDDIYTLCELLTHRKQNQNKMDFAELISNAVSLLPEMDYSPDYIIIDEFQDCDDRQIEFIRTLADEHTHLFAVGDPNQVIYTWRGSKADLFERFINEFQATVYDLPVNYRSCDTILEAAKQFLQNGCGLVGVRDTGSKIVVKRHYDPFNEANYLAERITALHAKGLPFREIAVLYRLQRQSRVIEDVFHDYNIPCTVSVRKTLKDIPVLGWFIQLLRCSINPDDTDSLIRALTDDQYGSGLIKQQIVLAIRGTEALEDDLYRKIMGFASTEFKSANDLWDYFSLKKHLHPNAESYERDKSMVEKLIHRLDRFICDRQLSVNSGVKEYINSSALFGVDYLDDEIADDEDTVKLMTFHAAKGLEFKYVFITGANQGLIPLRAFGYESDEEEKRLFFVGITRAKDMLEISYWANPDRQDVQPKPSIYLAMIPKRLMIREDIDQQQEQPVQSLRQKLKELIGQKSEPILLKGGSVMKDTIHRYARHAKYGDGRIVTEDNAMITVDFPEYGEKQFVKMFGEIEILTGQDTLIEDNTPSATEHNDISAADVRDELEAQYQARELSFQETISDLESILRDYQQREKEYLARIAALENEVLQVRQREDALRDKAEQLKAEVHLYQQKEVALQQQVTAAETMITGYQQTTADMQNQIESTQKKEEHLQKEAELSERVRSLEQQVKTQAQLIDDMEDHSKKQQTEITELQEALDTLQQELSVTHAEYRSVKERSSERDESICATTAQLQEILLRIETGVDELKCLFSEKKKREILNQIHNVKQTVACMINK